MKCSNPTMAFLASSALVLAAVATPVAAQAEPPPGEDVVASGLNSPRHLTFTASGDLYIAESGAPGPGGPCLDHPEFGEQCLAATGSVTMVDSEGNQERIVSGLPALVGADDVVGPSGILVRGTKILLTIGLGNNADGREAFGPDAEALGTLVQVRTTGTKRGEPVVLADLAAHEDADPDGAGADSNPVDVSRDRNGYLVADAGGNTLVRVDRGGAETSSVLPPTMAPAPPFLGLPPGTEIPAQSVPTATAQGPDGAWYVSELTGFPFPVGGSRLWRIGGDGIPEVWATGLTNVTDLEWDGEDLYAVQIADGGLLDGPVGSLVRVDPGGAHETVGGPWFAPYGVAIRDGHAYVTTGSVIPGGGEVVRVPLD